jgi:hypothetical protein
MRIPKKTYVGLYGSHSGDWRSVCVKALDNHQIPWYIPTDEQWKAISDKNGDSYQGLINRLVAKQHRGMLNASCVIFHLARRKSYHYGENKPKPDDTRKVLTAFAARCELGFLIGRGIQTFVHIEPNVEGRNYLWAAMKNYTHIVRSQSLEDATGQAIRYILGLDSFKR